MPRPRVPSAERLAGALPLGACCCVRWRGRLRHVLLQEDWLKQKDDQKSERERPAAAGAPSRVLVEDC